MQEFGRIWDKETKGRWVAHRGFKLKGKRYQNKGRKLPIPIALMVICVIACLLEKRSLATPDLPQRCRWRGGTLPS
jgi:hypothetical protein